MSACRQCDKLQVNVEHLQIVLKRLAYQAQSGNRYAAQARAKIADAKVNRDKAREVLRDHQESEDCVAPS